MWCIRLSQMIHRSHVYYDLDFYCTHDTKHLCHEVTKMELNSAKSTKGKRKKGCKKKANMPKFTNPWPYAEKLPALKEDMKLSKEDLGELECRFEYSINCNTSLMTSF